MIYFFWQKKSRKHNEKTPGKNQWVTRPSVSANSITQLNKMITETYSILRL